MINLLIVDRSDKERTFLERSSHRQILRCIDDYCDYRVFSSFDEAERYVEQSDSIDIALIEIADKKGLELVGKIRNKYSAVLLLLIASSTIVPGEYVIPEVSPNSLILRPAQASAAEEIIKHCFDWFFKKIYNGNSDKSYCFKGKDGRMVIEYTNIAYFESREKRIVLSTDNDEYYFYDTIDNLAQTLPGSFVRCHRSFIVNAEKIRNLRLSDNCLFLDNGFIVPVSRSYKAELKERFRQ